MQCYQQLNTVETYLLQAQFAVWYAFSQNNILIWNLPDLGSQFYAVCVTCIVQFVSFAIAADGKRNQNGVGADCDDLGLSGRYCWGEVHVSLRPLHALFKVHCSERCPDRVAVTEREDHWVHQLNWIGSGKRKGLHIDKIHLISLCFPVFFGLKLNQSYDLSMNSITDQPLFLWFSFLQTVLSMCQFDRIAVNNLVLISNESSKSFALQYNTIFSYIAIYGCISILLYTYK